MEHQFFFLFVFFFSFFCVCVCVGVFCHYYSCGGFLFSQPILMTAVRGELSSLAGVGSLPEMGR